MPSRRPAPAPEATPAPESHGAARAWRLLPLAAFLALTLLTWRRWVLPFQDSGREMLTPARVASGEVHYRDVASHFGPLPVLIDAAALKLFGRDLDVLIALRVLVALLGVEALRRLAARLAGDARVGAAAATLVVAACLFGAGGNWPFPYSIAALEGTVAIWWALELALSSEGWGTTLAAGLLAGLAAGTKVELLAAAPLAVGPALLLRRPRREALAALGLALLLGALAIGLPLALFGVETMRESGFLVAAAVPEQWQRSYRNTLLFLGMSQSDWVADFAAAWLPSIAFFGAALALVRARLPEALRALLLAGLALLVLGPLRVNNAELAFLVPFAALLSAAYALRLVVAWRRGARPAPSEVEEFSTAAAALPALARQPFFLRNAVYSAFSAPLALAVSLGWLARRARAPRAFAGFLVAVAALRAWVIVEARRGVESAPLVIPHVRLVLPAEEAEFLRSAAEAVERSTPPGSWVVVVPDPGVLLFSTGRRFPYATDALVPGSQDAGAEDEMIRRLDTRPPAAVLVTNRRYEEFGGARFGAGFLDRFAAELDRRYYAAAVLGGAAARPLGAGMHATGGVLFLPRGTPPPRL